VKLTKELLVSVPITNVVGSPELSHRLSFTHGRLQARASPLPIPLGLHGFDIGHDFGSDSFLGIGHGYAPE
jgi:hypothetical protein